MHSQKRTYLPIFPVSAKAFLTLFGKKIQKHQFLGLDGSKRPTLKLPPPSFYCNAGTEPGALARIVNTANIRWNIISFSFSKMLVTFLLKVFPFMLIIFPFKLNYFHLQLNFSFSSQILSVFAEFFSFRWIFSPWPIFLFQ